MFLYCIILYHKCQYYKKNAPGPQHPSYHKLSQVPFLTVNLIFAAFLLWYDFSYFATRIHSRYLIYSFGFFAPFFAQFPKLGILLSILMVANFLLPNKNPILSSLVYVLNQPAVVAVFTIYGFLLFLGLYQAYVKKLSSH